MSEQRVTHHLPLAQGELSPKDAAELQQLKQQILREIGLFCDGYKEQCLRRRIGVRMRARGLHSYSEYAQLLSADPAEHHKLLDAVTINVSKFYRNQETWRTLEREVVPRLFDWRARPVRLWSAGCASGEEPYSLAMLVREYAARQGRERALSKFEILATDIDKRSLQEAHTGEYGTFAFSEIEPALRELWFEPPAFTRVVPRLRSAVRFAEHDLISDDLPAPCHLILCRNVIIYFERSVQEELFVRFHEALAPGGFLVLGKVETIFGRGSGLFKPIAQRERVFVKV